jgi:hypothetical protein
MLRILRLIISSRVAVITSFFYDTNFSASAAPECGSFNSVSAHFDGQPLRVSAVYSHIRRDTTGTVRPDNTCGHRARVMGFGENANHGIGNRGIIEAQPQFAYMREAVRLQTR